jgi:flavin reductase (DIM6/NTAB) family NADH-FMN oxidoreductase RutF
VSAVAPIRERFLDAMAELPAGVTVVTAAGAGGAPLGATVSAVSSLSLEPALVVVCLARSSETCRALEPSSPFLVHVLRDGQEDVARALAGKGPDKFAAVAWTASAEGPPELPGCAVTLACSVDALVPGGDHVIVVGAVGRVERGEGTPLVYHRRRMRAAHVEPVAV